jgi:hypothetical protein
MKLASFHTEIGDTTAGAAPLLASWGLLVDLMWGYTAYLTAEEKDPR